MISGKRYLNWTLTAIAVIAISLTGTTTSDAAFDEKDIAGMWTFEEGKGKVVEDLSGNGTDGEFVGDLKWAKGKFGGGLEFNGQDTWVKLGTKGEDKTLAALDFKDSKGFSIFSIHGSMQQKTRQANVLSGKGWAAQRGRSFYLERVHTKTAKIARRHRFISEPITGHQNLKSSAMKSPPKSGYTSSAHGMGVQLASILTANYKTLWTRKGLRGHPPKRYTSVRIPAAVNVVSGTASLMKLLFSISHSLMMTL